MYLFTFIIIYYYSITTIITITIIIIIIIILLFLIVAMNSSLKLTKTLSKTNSISTAFLKPFPTTSSP